MAPFTDRMRPAVAAYLARFEGFSREHTESDLRWCLTWCAGRGLDPLAAQRSHLKLYFRWMQEIRRFKPSTVSRRFSVAAGFTGPVSSTECWSILPEPDAERLRANPGGGERGGARLGSFSVKLSDSWPERSRTLPAWARPGPWPTRPQRGLRSGS